MERAKVHLGPSTLRRLAAAAGLLSVAAAVAPLRVGLMTNFADVIVDRVPRGVAVDVTELSAVPYALTNRSRSEVAVAVRPEVPDAAALQPGYEAVPDAGWLRVSPDRFTLKPGETARGTVTLTVPSDGRWKGRHFQAAVWSFTERQSVAVGLRSRVRFSVEAPRPAAPAAAVSGLRFVTDEVTVEAEPGVTVSLPELNLANDGSASAKARVRSFRAAADGDFVPGPDASFLRPSEETVEVAAGAEQPVGLTLTVPAGAAHRGRSYVFGVRAETKPGDPAAPSARVYVRVRGRP
jgi:hypothetical protein